MGPSLRQFGVLVAAAVPPLIALAVLFMTASDWVASAGLGTVVLVVGLGAVGWSAIVLLVAGRGLSSEVRAVVELAERGQAGGDGASNGGGADAQRRTLAALDERNRQIAALAADMATTSMTGRPTDAASAVVATARSVMRDPTWQLVVLHADMPALLPVGVYDDHPRDRPAPLLDLHAWAAVAESEQPDAGPRRSRYLTGPWGDMVAVDVSVEGDFHGLLLAPWAGRAAPSPSEMDVLGLVGQHAATAIEHALLYARLRRQTDELNRMAVVQADFLRSVTHDLQTPLTSIGTAAASLAATSEVTAPERADLETIASQADRLRRMVGQLLVVSRLEAGALTPRQEVFRLEPVIRRTWAALRDPNHTLVVTTSGPMHLTVADPDRVEQVLWALFDNAVKYAPMAPEVRVDIQATTTDGGLESVVTVRDRGPGIDHGATERAFDQFFRADAARQAVPDGSGVGLYAARGLVEAMGGRISIGPDPDGGTAVRVALPAEAVEPEVGEEVG